ncbi:MAG: ADP-ribosyl-[dinitrogen reductase] hydrolase [Gaiellales bacterium]|jgi:ADP-ribosyl-[dinitrogen reductase] hydrolase|nr:ADP-ribosyl-[dinitrogen reductase] hydrolase [Gaiellales bacterium]
MRLLTRRDDDRVFDRARGVMLGLAVGDALGAALEWSHPEQIERRFGGPLRDMVASPVWELGEWTDDTAMAIELAESLGDRGDYDEDDLLARYLVWARSGPKDIGITVSKALARARTPDDARAAAARWHEASGGKSAGNGALMRTAPIAIRYRRNAGELMRVSLAEAGLTHHDPLAGDACVLFNRTLAAHLNGSKPKPLPTIAGQAAMEAPHMSKDELLELVQRQIGFVLTTLRVAFWACSSAESFEDAVVAAANLGGDADTNAAVTGALAGAQFGAEAIPMRWLEPLHQRDHIGGLAMRLLRA